MDSRSLVFALSIGVAFLHFELKSSVSCWPQVIAIKGTDRGLRHVVSVHLAPVERNAIRTLHVIFTVEAQINNNAGVNSGTYAREESAAVNESNVPIIRFVLEQYLRLRIAEGNRKWVIWMVLVMLGSLWLKLGVTVDLVDDGAFQDDLNDRELANYHS